MFRKNSSDHDEHSQVTHLQQHSHGVAVFHEVNGVVEEMQAHDQVEAQGIQLSRTHSDQDPYLVAPTSQRSKPQSRQSRVQTANRYRASQHPPENEYGAEDYAAAGIYDDTEECPNEIDEVNELKAGQAPPVVSNDSK